MSKRLAVVVPLHCGLPTTLPSTLEKALSGAVLTEECLVLPLASIQITLASGVVLSMTELCASLIPLGGGCVSISEWRGLSRDFSFVLPGSAPL